MQYMKALVIGMGVLIVLGVGLLVYGLLAKPPPPATPPSQSMSEGSNVPKGFGELALTGNAGCRIERAAPNGRWLVIELAPASDGASDLRCEKAVIIDTKAGTITGSIALQP
jgi:hypothetical protein